MGAENADARPLGKGADAGKVGGAPRTFGPKVIRVVGVGAKERLIQKFSKKPLRFPKKGATAKGKTREEPTLEVETCHRSEAEWQPPSYFSKVDSFMTLAQPYRFDGAFRGMDSLIVAPDADFELPSLDDTGDVAAADANFSWVETSFELAAADDDQVPTTTPTKASCKMLPPAGSYSKSYFDW